MGCLNPAKGRYNRVYPCVESVRGWYQRGRYEEVPGEEIGLDPQPNPVQAHCGRCKQVRSVWPVRGESEYRNGEWMDEGQPVMLQVHEAIRCDVKHLKAKSEVQWKGVHTSPATPIEPACTCHSEPAPDWVEGPDQFPLPGPPHTALAGASPSHSRRTGRPDYTAP